MIGGSQQPGVDDLERATAPMRRIGDRFDLDVDAEQVGTVPQDGQVAVDDDGIGARSAPSAARRSTISGPTPEASPIVIAIGVVMYCVPFVTRSTSVLVVPKPPGLQASRNRLAADGQLAKADPDTDRAEHGNRCIADERRRRVATDQDHAAAPATRRPVGEHDRPLPRRRLRRPPSDRRAT